MLVEKKKIDIRHVYIPIKLRRMHVKVTSCAGSFVHGYKKNRRTT